MAKKKAAASNLSASIAKRAKDKTEFGKQFIDLPSGIRDGVAQLVDAHLGEYKNGAMQGQQFLYLAGSIHEPASATSIKRVFADGKVHSSAPTVVNLVGQRTSNTFPLCDARKKSEEENVAIALNELRKIGVDTGGLGDLEDLKALLVSAVEVGPFFKFGTSSSAPTSQYPDERVWENWNEPVDGYEPSQYDGVVDNTGTTQETFEMELGDEPLDLVSLGEAADADDEEAANTLAGLAEESGFDPNKIATWVEVANMLSSATDDAPAAEVDEPEELVENDDAVDNEALGVQADEEGEESEAALTLTARAGACGLDPDAYGTWAELATAIEGGSEDSDEAVPEENEVWKYKPPRAKVEKEMAVTAVDVAAKTVSLNDEATGKEYTDVPFSKLS